MRRCSPVLILGILALPSACTGRPPERRPPVDSAPRDARYPSLRDSLVLSAPGGITVWFSGARVGRDSAGDTCVERGLVIVRDGGRTLVPLLMTGAAPTLVNDTTIRARLWLHCQPGDTYEVSLKTGRPSRV